MTIQAQLADGRTLEFPDGTDPNVIQAAVKQQLAAPVQAGISEEQRAAGIQEVVQDVGPFQAAAIGAGRGMMSIVRGLGLADPESPAGRQAFKALEEERPISTTIGEVAGEAAPFLLPGLGVAKAVTIPGRIAAAGALGATEAGIIAKGRGGDEFEALKAAGLGGAVAGALELALPVVGRVGGKLVRKVLGRPATSPVLDAAGNPSIELAEALEKSGLSLEDISVESRRLLDTGDVDDIASVARKSFLEAQGITPTRAQITGGAAEFQAQQELAKTSGRVRRAIETQEEILSNRFEHAVTSTGGSANRSNSTAIDFIADRSIDLDAAISNAYQAARDLAPTEKVIKPSKLTESVREIAGSDKATGGLASATRDILRAKGILKEGKGLKAVGRVNAQVAEEIRIDMNALHNSLTPFGKKKLAVLKDSLDNDVQKAIGVDVFSEARSAKAGFEKDLRRAKVNKFDTRKKNLVRDILENKVNPDRFLDDAILSKSIRSDDVEQLKRFLQIDADAPGIAAWNDVRAEAMQRIKDTAFKEVAGEPVLSRAGLEKALDRFGRDKLRVLFTKEERGFLTDMLKTSKLREPVRGTALGRGPSAQAIGRLEAVVKRIPLISGMFEGLATDAQGRIALRAPTISPLQPSQLTRITPAAIPALIATEEQQ